MESIAKVVLTPEGVQAEILRARVEQDTAMGLRMDGLVDRVNTKLDHHRDELAKDMQKLGEQVASSIEKVLTHQVEQDQKYDSRAILDDKFRNETREEIRQLRHRMKLLSWLMVASKTIKDAVETTTTMAEHGKGLLTGIAAVCSSASLIWLFFHQMLPYIKALLHH